MGNSLEGSRDKKVHDSSCRYSSQKESGFEDRLGNWEIGQNAEGEDMSRREIIKSIPIFGA